LRVADERESLDVQSFIDLPKHVFVRAYEEVDAVAHQGRYCVHAGIEDDFFNRDPSFIEFALVHGRVKRTDGRSNSADLDNLRRIPTMRRTDEQNNRRQKRKNPEKSF
jgi:hypothetical protein